MYSSVCTFSLFSSIEISIFLILLVYAMFLFFLCFLYLSSFSLLCWLFFSTFSFLFFFMMSLSVYISLQYSVHLSFISSLSIRIFPFLSFTAVVFDCHFLFTDLTSLYTSLDFLSPAHCSMFLHCCSNHSCLSFLADVLVSLHNFLYFLF